MLIGDNGEKDPEVYDTIRIENPAIRFYTFIRFAYGGENAQKFRANQIPFVSAGEIAMSLIQTSLI